MFKEFKKFIARGNVMDLAVGVIIGGAFSKIVTSLVDDILMPIIGMVVGGVDFSSLSYTASIKGLDIPPAEIKYGLFIQNVVDFLIVAFVIFLIVRTINKMNAKMDEKVKKLEEKLGKKEEETPAPLPEVPEDIKLLREINANLKKMNSSKKKD